ncbi:Serine/threonine-protein kinase-transforming protein, partial [Stegodyphus mimosarum]
MEFAGHCNLQQILNSKSEFDFPRRLSFCSQIISGLQHCHTHGIVHGDIKPANVIVSPYGICKLGDFGHSIRHAVEIKPLSQDDEFIGTAAYAAPEVLKGNAPTPLSDIYSFGILLWQVQTREVPFGGEHPHVIIYKVVHYTLRPIFKESLNPCIRQYASLAQRCWDDSPSNRPNSSEVYEILKEIIHIMKDLNK